MLGDDGAITLFELPLDQLRQEVLHICAFSSCHGSSNSLNRRIPW